MAKYNQKTKVEPISVEDFIVSIESPQRQVEARQLVQVYGTASGYEPRLFTGGMIGFGRYDYTYPSGHSGTSFATGFAPRKADLSLYGLKGSAVTEALLPKLGMHSEGKGCVYAKRLSDLDQAVLHQLIVAGLDNLKTLYPMTPE